MDVSDHDFYSVTFTFFDDKTLSKDVAAADISRFIECIGKGEVFWEKNGDGYWLCAEKVRCMHAKKIVMNFPDPIAY